jgi:hypothetical protein
MVIPLKSVTLHINTLFPEGKGIKKDFIKKNWGKRSAQIAKGAFLEVPTNI